MGRLFTIAWPRFEKSVEAEMLQEQDPKLCQDFWDALGLKEVDKT